MSPKLSSVALLRCGLLLPALISAACDGAPVPQSAPAAPAETSPAATASLGAAPPVLEIGRADGSDADLLYRVAGALRTSDGGLAVLNAGTNEVRLYDVSGTLVRTLGREGAGPGEFRFPVSLRRTAGDTAVVWDRQLRRLTRVPLDGGAVSTSQLPAPIPVALGVDTVPSFPDDIWLVGGDRIAATPGFTTQVLGRGRNGVRRDTVSLTLIDRAGNVAGSIGPVAGAETLVHNGSSMPFPFGRRLHVAAAADELFVNAGDGALHVYDATGQLLRTVTLGIEPEPLQESQYREAIERLLSMTDPAARPTVETMLAGVRPPRHRPVVGAMIGGSDGLWVQRHRLRSDSIQSWLRVDASGAVLARTDLPATAEVLDIGADFVVLLRRDEHGVERISVHPLERAGEPSDR
jgi:hypothetical protein